MVEGGRPCPPLQHQPRPKGRQPHQQQGQHGQATPHGGLCAQCGPYADHAAGVVCRHKSQARRGEAGKPPPQHLRTRAKGSSRAAVRTVICTSARCAQACMRPRAARHSSSFSSSRNDCTARSSSPCGRRPLAPARCHRPAAAAVQGNISATQHLPSTAGSLGQGPQAAPPVPRCAPQDAIRSCSAQHKSTTPCLPPPHLYCTHIQLEQAIVAVVVRLEAVVHHAAQEAGKDAAGRRREAWSCGQAGPRWRASNVHATGRPRLGQKGSAHFFKAIATNSRLTCPHWPSMRLPSRARPAAGRRAPAPASAARAPGGSRCCRSRCAAEAARRSTGASTGPHGSRCGGQAGGRCRASGIARSWPVWYAAGRNTRCCFTAHPVSDVHLLMKGLKRSTAGASCQRYSRGGPSAAAA